jgi:hypothetical protein
MGVEKALYLVMRIGIAGAGLLVVLATLSSHFLTPELYYDEAPGPPPLREQLPAILSGVGIGLLVMVPHRWTRHAWLFWPRLAVYALIAAFCLWRAIEGVLEGLGGAKSWHIFPASVVIGCIGVALPLCLLWSRRLRRAG